MGAVLCEEEVMAGSPQVGVRQPRGYGGGNPSDLLDALRGDLPISSTAVLCCGAGSLSFLGNLLVSFCVPRSLYPHTGPLGIFRAVHVKRP